MATDSQINANRKNAQNSTGPRTTDGKAISARNALTLGLFTKTDYVRPDEQSEYNDLCARCVTELNPSGFLEETLVMAILSARWRLRRCGLVERQLVDRDHPDPMIYGYDERVQNSVDRARATASLLLRRSIIELRHLQTDRAIAARFLAADPDLPALASARQLILIERRQSHTAKSASNCDGAQSDRAQTLGSGRCPCGSGEKFKRCCGKDAPPVLGPVEKAA